MLDITGFVASQLFLYLLINRIIYVI